MTLAHVGPVGTKAELDGEMVSLAATHDRKRVVLLTPEEPITFKVDWAGEKDGDWLGVLDLVVLQGGSEPMHPDWVRRVRDECLAAGVAFAFTGWGEWVPDDPAHGEASPGQDPNAELEQPWAEYDGEDGGNYGDHTSMLRVGSAHSGDLLDGERHPIPAEFVGPVGMEGER